MSRLATTKIRCPGCSLNTEAHFRPPGFMRPTIFQVKCSGCGSNILVRIEQDRKTKPKRTENGTQLTLKVNVKVAEASIGLVEMLKEEAEFNKKIQEIPSEVTINVKIEWDPSMTLIEVERAAIIACLIVNKGNRSQTARDLKTSLRNITNKIREYKKQGCKIPKAIMGGPVKCN